MSALSLGPRYLPSTHSSQEVPALPGIQTVQVALPLIEFLPRSQSKHMSALSLGPRYLPSTHSSQGVPALPGIQDIHVTLPGAADLPMTQATHSVAFCVSALVFTAHKVHVDCPF